MTTKLWLRAETKTGEARTALTPKTARTLIAEGFDITVETSTTRAIPDREFTELGCTMVAPGSWPDAPAETFILGLKELPEDTTALQHRHIYFAHAYKEQRGWEEILGRFRSGGGELLDLEYLLDERGRRVAAFGYWAGFAGAALAVMNWCGQQLGITPPLSNIGSWPNKNALCEQVKALLEQALVVTGDKPDIILIGAAGRVGSGAIALLETLNLSVTPWDMAETARGGPFSEIIQHNIFINCVLINTPLPPFVTAELIDRPGRRLSVIADVSCDPFGDYNPVPLYSHCTDFMQPAIRLRGEIEPLDLIAIDNLPSMLPLESSEDFSEQLLPTLLQLSAADSAVWKSARTLFHHHCNQIEDN